MSLFVWCRTLTGPLRDEIGFVTYDDTPPIQEGVDEAARLFVVHQQRKLGLSFEGIPAVYAFAHRTFADLLATNGTLCEQAADLLDLSRVLLIVNADNYTAWNVR
jgi:hypothetical protein